MKAIFVPSMGEASKIFPGLKFEEWKLGIMMSEFKGLKVFITGVTKTPASVSATAIFSNFDITEAILTGVCGAYHSSGLSVGDVVTISRDFFADEGLYTDNSFESVFEMGFGFTENRFICFEPFKGLPVANSNTISFLDGEGHISKVLEESTGAYVENMEGASFGYVCKLFKVKAFQIRAVSNYCGKRSDQNWDFKKAVKNLEMFFSSTSL